MNLLYYRFLIDQPGSFGTTSDEFADEVDVIVDYTLTDNVSFSLAGGWSNPDSAAKEFTGGNDDWLYGMMYTAISF